MLNVLGPHWCPKILQKEVLEDAVLAELAQEYPNIHACQSHRLHDKSEMQSMKKW